MIENYLIYLGYIGRKLEKYFKDQEPYIFCKKGCARCCEYGDYPFSKLELDYIMEGYSKLPQETKQTILKNINDLKAEKLAFTGEQFAYRCPFLINNECSVYEHRGIICRTFGLISSRENENSKIPFCAFEGLNYSNVLDAKNGIISEEKFLALNTDKEPLAYNIRYKTITSKNYEDVFKIKFGEVKSLIEWFM